MGESLTKTRTPFFSLGAQGSVGGLITAQKRHQSTLIRTKPFPTDPYSLPQAYQRWLYQDYAYLWTQQTLATKRSYAATGAKYHLTGQQYWMKIMLSTLPDIAGMWHLDEKSGTTVRDFSKNNNTGTIYGASPTAGLIDGAYYFDGLNDYIRTTTNLTGAPLGASPRTIEFFIKVNLITAVNMIVTYGHASTGHQIALLSHTSGGNGRLWLGFYNINCPSDLFLTQSIWHYICAQVIDSTHCLFRLDNTEQTATADGVINTLTGLLFIGAGFTIDVPLKGNLDHLVIYNRLLDKSERDRHSLRRYPP